VHRTGDLGELVCSNSLRGDSMGNAVGLLKAEMELLGSLVMNVARATAVPAGGALAVDRDLFARRLTEAVETHPRIRLERRVAERLPEHPSIIATGPLTAAELHRQLGAALGENALSFFDAIAPIVTTQSLDLTVLFRASRYDKGSGSDYLNAPLDRQEYERFLAALMAAETVRFADFEEADMVYFEGCLPIEVMAARGPDTLRYGPMKPVGLTNPASGRRPWAVVQLRQDDLSADQYNLVGFQTKLKKAEQKRVFRLIPGLQCAEFSRFGMIHRNTFINAPEHLDALLHVKRLPHLRLAGQLTGVEGYVESAATGLLAGLFVGSELAGRTPAPPPAETACGGLIRHLTMRHPNRFQPSNITWGLIPCADELRQLRGKQERRQAQAQRALELLASWQRGLKG